MYHGAAAATEQNRLRALHNLDLLDTAPEPEFDELVQLAAAICRAPISMVSLVDEDRQWFKAVIGLDVDSTAREVAFCDHAIRQPDLMLVEDATLDPRFANNPMVVGDAGWRFYAGMPVTDPEGLPVGTLCVMDHVPRTLTTDQRNALRILASQANARLELRIKRRELEHALACAEAATVRLTASEQRFQSFMDSGPFMAFLKDADGRLLYYNQRWAEHFGVSRTLMLDKTDAELWPAHLAAIYRAHDLETLRSNDLCVVDEQTIGREGDLSTWRSFKFPCTETEGQALVGGISLDVTEELKREAELQRSRAELELANRQLRELASVDALTGLANRRSFDEQFRAAFRRARRTNAPLSLLMLDVDHFKLHNDRFGHAHGDEVLRILGQLLRAQVRAGDLVARYGGEEFIVLLAETEEAKACSLAHRLLEEIRQHSWPLAPVTASIGLSSIGPATPDTGRLLTLADEALYAAKCSGRDRVVPYSEVYANTLKQARERMSLQEILAL
jgi:diguanylate cyclase (GGDEF)-like protein/PAS domain S-box-containing protein